MIAVMAQTRIWVAVEPADFRCGIDGLARVCRQKLKADPFCGALFVFRNRRSTSVKILAYDGIGFWLCQKRLRKRGFCWWPKTDDGTLKLEARDRNDRVVTEDRAMEQQDRFVNVQELAV